MRLAPVRRILSAQQIDLLAGMYHLVHSSASMPWRRVGQDYKNEADEPVLVRTALITPHGTDQRIGRFQLSKNVHGKLLERGGHYLFVAYRENSYGSPVVVHHALHPASKFEIGEGKTAKIHPRDVFEGVVG